MSKSEDTKRLILDTAKKEFSEKGYNDASIRKISKSAGLTTGAIFRYYPDKNSLFSALVAPVANHLLETYKTGGSLGFDSLTEGSPEQIWDISKKILDDLVEYVFENKDVFHLLIDKSAGSSYENFVDLLIEEEEKQTYAFQQEMLKLGYKCRPLERKEIHILMSAQYHAFFEIVRHRLEKEEAIELVHLISDFFSRAWKFYFA